MTLPRHLTRLGLDRDLPAVNERQAAFLSRHRPAWRVQSLAELWWLRQRFWDQVDSPLNLCGSFLGFQWSWRRYPHLNRNRPAVVVLLPREQWPPTVGGEGRMLFAGDSPFQRPLWCWVDTITAPSIWAPKDSKAAELNARNRAWIESQLNRPDRLRPGAAIRPQPGPTNPTPEHGAAGPVLRLGQHTVLATAAHVVGVTGTRIELVAAGPGHTVGTVSASFLGGPMSDYLDGVLAALCRRDPPTSLPEAHRHWTDSALVEVEAPAACEDGLPPWVTSRAPGQPFELDLARSGFEPLGRPVISVGPTRGVQFGRIIGFSVHHTDLDVALTSSSGPAELFVDYLIKPLPAPGEALPREFGAQFSDAGDSGKGVWTWPDLQPIAVLAGAGNPDANIGRGSDFWSVANDLSRSLKRAGLWNEVRAVEPLSQARGPEGLTPNQLAEFRRTFIGLRRTSPELRSTTPLQPNQPMEIRAVIPDTQPTTCVAVFPALAGKPGLLCFAPGSTTLAPVPGPIGIEVLAGSCEVTEAGGPQPHGAKDRFLLEPGPAAVVTVAPNTMCVWLSQHPWQPTGNHPRPQ